MDQINPIVEAASWRIATEICRRSPEIKIRHTRPGGGMYDCLSLVGPSKSHAHFNRVGSFHVFNRLDGKDLPDSWDV